MFTDDEKNSEKLRKRGTTISLWMALTILAACITVILTLFTTAVRAQPASSHDPANGRQSAIFETTASDIYSRSDDNPLASRTVLFGLMISTFALMAGGAYGLSRRSFKDVVKSQSRRKFR